MAINKKRLIWQVPFLVLLIVGTIIIVRRQSSIPYQHNEGLIFGTVYHITYQADSNFEQGIKQKLEEVDSSLSMFNKQSVISKVNANVPVDVDDNFKYVFNLAEHISKETDGAFDITVAPLVNLWGFGFKSGATPTQAAIDSARALTGYKKVKLNGRRVVKENPETMLDCSAIAKGYGSDVVARYLESQGVDNYMVEIGGEVVTKGNSPKRLPWKIGVTKPVDDSTSVEGELQTVLNVTNMAMATSGNYRNFYYKGGRKYAHTIDPKSGKPVQHSLLSSTVLAPNCATADAYATSFMVMGIDKAKAVLKRHPDLMAYFIYSDNSGKLRVWYSDSMKGKIVD